MKTHCKSKYINFLAIILTFENSIVQYYWYEIINNKT